MRGGWECGVRDAAAAPAVLASRLLDAGSRQEVLERAVRSVPELVAGADLVSITTLDRDGRLHTPAGSAEAAFALDRLQYECGEGACVTAVRSGTACAGADLADDPRWPAFGPAAARLGARALVSTPLPGGEQDGVRAALNAYATGSALAPDRRLLATAAAEIALAASAASARVVAAQLREALGRRDTIGMAKGILMSRRGIDAAAAFELLRGLSQDHNVKVRDLAATLVAHHTEIDLR